MSEFPALKPEKHACELCGDPAFLHVQDWFITRQGYKHPDGPKHWLCHLHARGAVTRKDQAEFLE